MKCTGCGEETREIATTTDGQKMHFCCECDYLYIGIKGFATLNFQLKNRRFSVMGVPGDGGVKGEKCL